MSLVSAHDPQLARLADAIAQRVGQQRFHVWFNNSTRLDLRQDGLEIAVPNDFISEWIGKNFTRPIQEAAHEVLGGPLLVRFSVVPELFEVGIAKDDAAAPEPPLIPSTASRSLPQGRSGQAHAMGPAALPQPSRGQPARAGALAVGGIRPMPQVPAHEANGAGPIPRSC